MGGGGRGARGVPPGRTRPGPRGGAGPPPVDGPQPAARRRARRAPRNLACLGEPAAARAPRAGGAGAAGDGVSAEGGGEGEALRLGTGGEVDRVRAIFASLGAAPRWVGDDGALV